MKKRTFFVMLILFLILLNSMLLIVSVIILNDKLSTARDKCLAEHYVIATSLIGGMQALEQRGNNVEECMDQLMSGYSRYLKGKGSYLAVSFSGEWIYESASIMSKENLDFPPEMDYRQERIVYMDNETVPVLCVYGSFPAPWQEYGLMYVGSLEDAVLSLRQISSASTKIAKGNYEIRLLVQGKDEIASVAHNFNLMARQVETQIQHLQEIAEQKQQFIDNFSHELRIPLTAIYGYAEYIQKAPISEEERYECTQFIMSECTRLQKMAYQLLDIALLREDELEKGDCMVAELFEQSEKVMHVKAAEKKINLSYNKSQNLLIRGDKEQLLIVLNNLIDNAIKASWPEGEICVSAYLEEAGVVVEVEDHGIGMEPDQISNIKEAFYRVDKARSRAAGGAGLGLSICEKIMQLHHGKLTFNSEHGKGTKVRMHFPKDKKESFTGL